MSAISEYALKELDPTEDTYYKVIKTREEMFPSSSACAALSDTNSLLASSEGEADEVTTKKKPKKSLKKKPKVIKKKHILNLDDDDDDDDMTDIKDTGTKDSYDNNHNNAKKRIKCSFSFYFRIFI
eukprot:513792_1